MHIFGFEKLSVWEDVKALTKMIYQITNDFPAEEKYGLVSQLRRASISVGSNLAEGSSRLTRKEQAHFYSIAYSSLMEVLSQVIISKELGYLDEKYEAELRDRISKVSFKINALRKATLAK